MGEGLKQDHTRGDQMEAISNAVPVRTEGALAAMTVAEKEELEPDCRGWWLGVALHSGAWREEGEVRDVFRFLFE